MKQKEKYEAPCTACTEVELESGLLEASVVEREDPMSNDEVTIRNQEIEGNFDFTSQDPWQ